MNEIQELDDEQLIDNFIDCEIDRLKEEEYEKKQYCQFCRRGNQEVTIEDGETLQEVNICKDCFNQLD